MTSPHERLDQAMEQRRLDLGMRWGDVATAASIAEVTLRAVRRGENQPSALTRRRIEDALRWEHGSIEAILNGDEPTALGTGRAGEDRGEKLRRLIEEFADDPPIREMLRATLRTWELLNHPADTDKSSDSETKRAS